jgi:hypothetical protein
MDKHSSITGNDDQFRFAAATPATNAIRCRWDALTSVGLNISTNVYVLTNAKHYKSFEFWAFGKGLPLGHIINTGGSLGDIRYGELTNTEYRVKICV